MDPLERINFTGDSTFALMLEAKRRGHNLWFYTPDKLALECGRLTAHANPINVFDDPSHYYELIEPQDINLAEMDVVLLLHLL